MSVFSSCCTGFAALSRAAAKAAKAKLRGSGWLAEAPDWASRAEICERCPLRVVQRGVSYCGKPFLEKVDREPLDGCGCPTRAKAKDPTEHCPLTSRNLPAEPSASVCNCKWCSGLRP